MMVMVQSTARQQLFHHPREDNPTCCQSCVLEGQSIVKHEGGLRILSQAIYTLSFSLHIPLPQDHRTLMAVLVVIPVFLPAARLATLAVVSPESHAAVFLDGFPVSDSTPLETNSQHVPP